MRLLSFILLFLAFQVKAEDSAPSAHWIAPCKFEETEFSIQFNSKSGDAYQDDQRVTLMWGNNKAVVLPAEPALYTPTRFVSDAKNYCQGIGAFNWPNGRLLILIAKNDRPSHDEILAMVIDAKTGALLQNEGVIGAIWEHLLVLQQGQGYRALLERSWHVDPSDGSEFPDSDWMMLREDRGRLVHKWEIERK